MEKPFVIRWNIVGFAGGGAFVLSFLLGILSGSAFLLILLKAFIFGVIFALLGGGIAFLIERFIPEIIGGEAEGKGAAPSGKIDIVLDGDGKYKEPDIEELRLDDAECGADGDEAAGAADVASSRKRESALAPGDEASAVEEVGEEPAGGEVEAEFAEDLDAMEEPGAAAEEEGGAQTAPPPEEALPARPAAAADKGKSLEESDLDVLPDMSSFESSFSPVTSGGMVSDSDTFETFGTDSLKKNDLNQDPDTYVKAVRTIIKRDEGKKK